MPTNFVQINYTEPKIQIPFTINIQVTNMILKFDGRIYTAKVGTGYDLNIRNKITYETLAVLSNFKTIDAAREALHNWIQTYLNENFQNIDYKIYERHYHEF